MSRQPVSDLRVVHRQLRRDRPLARVITATEHPYAIPRKHIGNTFEYLVRAIVYQQLSGKAAATIHGRLLEHFERRKPTPSAMLDLDVATLRGAGVSRSKAASLHDLARRVLDGEIPSLQKLRHMDDEDIVEHLTHVRGIGRWTVEMLLMFGLRRPDVLPATDLGVRQGFAATYGLADMPAPAALLEHGERWRPYRSVAAWYMWRAVELHRAGWR